MHAETNKISVFLPDEIHRLLNLSATRRERTIQDLLEQAAESSLPANAPGPAAGACLSPRQKRDLVARFARLIESDAARVLLSCKATVEAMESLLARDERGAAVLEAAVPALEDKSGT